VLLLAAAMASINAFWLSGKLRSSRLPPLFPPFRRNIGGQCFRRHRGGIPQIAADGQNNLPLEHLLMPSSPQRYMRCDNSGPSTPAALGLPRWLQRQLPPQRRHPGAAAAGRRVTFAILLTALVCPLVNARCATPICAVGGTYPLCSLIDSGIRDVQSSRKRPIPSIAIPSLSVIALTRSSARR